MIRLSLVLIILWSMPLVLHAQDTTRARAQSPSPAPRLELSGVIFANYQSGGPRGARAQNRFDVERVYVTVLAPAGDRVSVRFTSDLFVQRDSTRDGYYRGWTMRAKYAWLQYDVTRTRPSGAGLVARLGLIHTPIAEYEESFFQRYISGGSTQLSGYFSTADAGVSTLWTLPGKRGEGYVSIINGNGYAARETDRFKDIGGRFSYTPFGARTGSFWSTLSLTPWYYKGWKASTAAASAGAARQKDRYGFFAGIRDPRLRAGVQIGRQVEESDAATGPVRLTGSLLSTFVVAKPGALANMRRPGPFAVVLRQDHVRTDRRSSAYRRFVIAGLQYDFNRRAAMALDVQVNRPRNGSTVVDTRTSYLHLVANF